MSSCVVPVPSGAFRQVDSRPSGVPVPWRLKGKPFTRQARLGCPDSGGGLRSLLMTFFIIIVYDVMGTDTMAGKYFRDLMEARCRIRLLLFPTQ